MGSFHEFGDRAGPKIEAEGFSSAADRFTYADMFRPLDEPVSVKPTSDWNVKDFRIQPAALTRQLIEGDTIETGRDTFRILHLSGQSAY